MKNKKLGNFWVLRLERGDKFSRVLEKFLGSQKISAGYFFGLGYASQVTLYHFNPQKKSYQDRTIQKNLEIINLIGNIARLDNKTIFHAHICLSGPDFKAIGGHLKDLICGSTVEIYLTKLPGKINRKLNLKIGLNLLDI
jgi:hypothetical protein